MKKLLSFLFAFSFGICMCSCSTLKENSNDLSEANSVLSSIESKSEESSLNTSEKNESSTELSIERSKENTVEESDVLSEQSVEIIKENSNDSSNEESYSDKPLSNVSSVKINALEKAKSYLRYSAFSYKGLIEQLEFEGFSTEEATYGADNCGANWNEQAAKKAKSYLNFSSFSRSELIDQLEFEGFTSEQATYGVDKTYDGSVSTPQSGNTGSGQSAGNINALEKAKSYLSYSAFSYKGLIEQLEFEGFSTEEATYGADNCGANWNEQAAKKAKSYLNFSSFSRSELIDQLEFEGFTSEQAAYGASQNGY